MQASTPKVIVGWTEEKETEMSKPSKPVWSRVTFNFTDSLEHTFIDPEARYGYWTHADGSEGGGLWFERMVTRARAEDKDFQLALVDYDGCWELPAIIIQELKILGIFVDEEIETIVRLIDTLDLDS